MHNITSPDNNISYLLTYKATAQLLAEQSICQNIKDTEVSIYLVHPQPFKPSRCIKASFRISGRFVIKIYYFHDMLW